MTAENMKVQLEDAIALLDTPNCENGVEIVKRMAEDGYGPAQNQLGYMYQNGIGVPQNDVIGVEWYQKAANQGDWDAMGNLTAAYSFGRGVQQNDELAVFWCLKMAEEGTGEIQMEARNLMGVMYQTGRGVPKSDEDAMKWFELAAAQGHADAAQSLAALRAKTTKKKGLFGGLFGR